MASGTAVSRPTLTVANLPAWRVPVHPSHRLALVGEAPGPSFDRPGEAAQWALYPYPPRSAAGRLKDMLGMGRVEYLETFARANLLDAYPGPVFPLSRARPLAAPLAQKLAPRPLVLLGRGVAQAFRFPEQEVCRWADYLLEDVWIRAAMVPHPSGRNLFYNCPHRREKVAAWIRGQVGSMRAEGSS